MKLFFIGIVCFLMACNGKSQTSNEVAHPLELEEVASDSLGWMYGDWRYVGHEWFPVGRLTKEEFDRLKQSTLKISEDSIYFENIVFSATKPCSYSRSSVKINKLLDKKNEWEYSWYEEGDSFLRIPKDVGPLIYLYVKEQLEKMDRVQLTDEFCAFRYFYVKDDTLILPNLEGVTLFLTKDK